MTFRLHLYHISQEPSRGSHSHVISGGSKAEDFRYTDNTQLSNLSVPANRPSVDLHFHIRKALRTTAAQSCPKDNLLNPTKVAGTERFSSPNTNGSITSPKEAFPYHHPLLALRSSEDDTGVS